MREIKFRFWDSNEKIMYEDCPHFAIGSDGSVSELKYHEGKTDADCDCVEWVGSAYYEHIIPLQYTGLKDKNGKEIFEGDILKHDTYENMLKVGFDNGSFKGISVNGFAGVTEIGFLNLSTYEVKGNIYEKPELLEV